VSPEQVPLFSSTEFESNDKEAVILTARSPLHKALTAFHTHMQDTGFSIYTIKAFDSDLRLLARFVGHEIPIGDISSNQLEAFLKYLRSGRGVPCKPKSLARRLTTLKVFFSWLANEEVISVDPAAPLVHRRVTTPLPRVLSEQEVAKLLSTTEQWRRDAERPDARPHLLLTLLLSTGIKKGECMNIALADIDASASAPSVFIRYESTRYRYKERKLRLPSQFPAILHEYLAQYKPQTKLFECTARNLEYVLRECAKRANLPPQKLSFETLRWTCAVRDFKAGMDPDALRRKLGLSHITWAETVEKLKKLTAPAL